MDISAKESIMKTLFIISKGMNKPPDEELEKLERENRKKRDRLLEQEISATVLDERYLSGEHGWFRKRLYRLIPISAAQIIETLLVHKNYDVVYVYSEKAGFPLSVCFRYLKIKTPLVMMVSRITSGDKRKAVIKKWLVKKGEKGVSSYIMWSSVQRKVAVQDLQIPQSKICPINRGTDQRFWHFIPKKTDMICSAGMEMRDYPTLVKALKSLNIPCHIATGAQRGELFNTVSYLYKMDEIPEHISIGRKSLEELRDLYARSRFVVVPILPTDSDNGLTTILEAMAMGKPVIYSKVQGQVDIVKDGITGIPVRPEDPDAMRNAIVELWNNPRLAAEMGREARRYIEQEQRQEDAVASIKYELQRAVNQNREPAGNPVYRKSSVTPTNKHQAGQPGI